MAAVAALPRPLTAARARLRLRRPSGPTICFFLCLALYLAAATYVTFTANYVLGGDGISRVAIANRILFSRDPHLAAIGFVWSPIPELVLVPLVVFKSVWPALVQDSLAGAIVSAFFMAGAAAQLLRILKDIGVSRRLCWVLTATFALNPMIVLFAVNGMSEALFLFFLLVLVRQLNRWLRTRELSSLVGAGFSLALCYLTRYEAIAAAAAVVTIVGFATAIATPGHPRRRVRLALLDSTIVVLPFVVAFVVWAVTSWLITGIAFQQFSSVYGTEPQLQAEGLGGAQTLAQEVTAAVQSAHWILGLEPFLPLAAIACLIVVGIRRDWAALALPAVLGAVLTFMVWADVSGSVLRALRYFIVVIPLVIVMVGVSLSRRRVLAAPAARRPRVFRNTARALGMTAAIAAMAVTIPVGLHSITDPAIDQSDAYPVQALLTRGSLTQAQHLASLRFITDRRVSRYIDSLRLPRGSVLLDDFLGYVIVMSSSHPDQYVITSDRDFQQVLADPAGNGVEYILVPPDSGLGTLDAVNRTYPGAYASGGGLGTLVKQFTDTSDYQHNWRLYRVKPPS